MTGIEFWVMEVTEYNSGTRHGGQVVVACIKGSENRWNNIRRKIVKALSNFYQT